MRRNRDRQHPCPSKIVNQYIGMRLFWGAQYKRRCIKRNRTAPQGYQVPQRLLPVLGAFFPFVLFNQGPNHQMGCICHGLESMHPFCISKKKKKEISPIHNSIVPIHTFPNENFCIYFQTATRVNCLFNPNP